MGRFSNPFSRQRVPVGAVVISFETSDNTLMRASNTWVREAGGNERTVRFNQHSHGAKSNLSYLFLAGDNAVVRKFANRLRSASVAYEVYRIAKNGDYEPYSL